MRTIGAVTRAATVAAVAAVALTLTACAGSARLSEAVDSIHREYGELQDQALLRNILRRSVGLPAHFTSLTTVRGRDRIDAGASLKLPFGGGADPSFEFSPNLKVDRGPNFEISTQANKEFFRGYLAPVGTTTIHNHLRQSHATEVVLSLLVERITLREGTADEQVVVNAPDRSEAAARFGAVLNRLIEQGLATEEVRIVQDVGPPLRRDGLPDLDQVLSVRAKGLVLERLGDPSSAHETSGAPDGAPAQFQLRSLDPGVRFCFRRATGAPYAEAQCTRGLPGSPRRFSQSDRSFFGTTLSPVAVLDAGDGGRVELQMRSLAEILDYLGAVVRAQLERQMAPPTLRGPDGPQPLFVVHRGVPRGDGAPAAVSVEFGGVPHTVPLGPAAGHSGAVLTIVSQLLAQAQSVRDLPASNTVTIVGD